MRKIILFSFCCWGLSLTLFAQSPAAIKVDKKIPVSGNENFDFIFTRSVMVGNVDSAAFEATRSGCYSLGIGYGLPIGKTLLLKFEPRVTWFKTYFNRTGTDKWFPSSDTDSTLIYEKQRVAYLEVPVSFKLKLARNNVERYKLLFEAGFVFGARLSGTAKTKHFSSISANGTLQGPKITVKTGGIQDQNRFRYGPFARIGTNWVSLYGFYRMSDVFRTDRQFQLPSGATRAYPSFPRLEVGITFAI